jgi:hypothetical protein
MLTATGATIVTTAVALNAFASLAEPTLPRALIEAGTKEAKCAIPPRKAKVVGNEWLGSGLQIVEVSCGSGGSILFALPVDPLGKSSLISVEDWRDGQIVAGHRVVAPRYEPDSRTLSSVEGKRGAADCGTIKEWQWTGWSFRLVHVWRKDVCDGEPFVWENRESWQVFPKPSEAQRHRVRGFSGPSLSKCPPRCSHQSSSRLGNDTSALNAKNHAHPIASATKPAPDDR